MSPFPLTGTAKDFFEAAEVWRLYKRGSLKEVGKLAGVHLRSGTARVSELAPCVAAIGCAIDTRWGHATFNVLRWFLQNVTYRNRPMWNDYHMARWQLTRDPKVIEDLKRHLERATNPTVIETGAWMVRSVAEQDPEFKALWGSAWLVTLT